MLYKKNQLLEINLVIYLFLFCVIFVLSSCSQDMIYSEIAPSWVNGIRSGNSSLRVNNGDKILFRSNHKGQKSDKQDEICSVAIEKNTSYIKKAYPFLMQIPMTVDLIFFDPKMNDCSTTISLPRELIEKAENLSELKKQYEAEIKRTKEKKQEVQTDLKKANSEKLILKDKIKKLDKIISKNKGYAKQIENIENIIKNINIERKNVKDKIEEYVYTGMSAGEVNKIMKNHERQVVFSPENICEKKFEHKTRYGDYIICGISISDTIYGNVISEGFVTQICNLRTYSCYTKKLKY